MSIDLALADARTATPSVTAMASPKRTHSSGEQTAAVASRPDLIVDQIQPQAGTGRTFADFIQLTKPRIVVMVLVTTVASSIIATGSLVGGMQLLWLLLGTAMVAGSAGAANQVWERRIDCHMPRTAIRPLPGNRMKVATATVFTAIIGCAGVGLLTVQLNAAAAIVGIATWLLYVLVYTPLKTRTAWNTTVGAIAGALPILIGYTATGGSLAESTGWLLVGVLVAWQYPHFMAIAWMYRHQYAAAGFRMTTTEEPTGRSAAIQSIAGSIALIACGVLLCVSTEQWLASALSSVAVLAVVFPMLRASIGFWLKRDDAQARRLLRSSLLVLPAVLLIVTLRVFW